MEPTASTDGIDRQHPRAARLDMAQRGATRPDYWLRLALLCLTAIRLVVCARMPVSADEAYYRVWSHALAAGYLDHPPMVALWIGAGTALVGDTALGIRLAGPLAALFGTLLLMRAAEDLAPGRGAGPPAAILLNATLVMNAGAVIMTPDTPLLFFWTAALACAARLLRTGRASWWLGIGLCAGLALDSKYTAALLAPCFGLWLVAVPGARLWLGRWQLWAGGILALGVFAPVLAWNAAHGWASFAKQGGRTADWQPAQALAHLGELLGGQIGLATPGLALLFCGGLAWAARGAWRRDPGAGLLACLTWLPALVFVEHAWGGRVQANWPAVIYPGAAIAAALWGGTFWQPAAWLGAAMSAAVMAQAAWAPLALPRALDFTLIRLAGWQDLAGGVYAARLRTGADCVAAEEYGLASELALYLHSPVVGVEWRWAYFRLPAAMTQSCRILLVRSVRQGGAPDPRLWSDVVPQGELVRARGGVAAETYRLYTARWAPRPGFVPPPAVFLPAAPLLKPL